MTDLERAKALLKGNTCVFVKGEEVFVSDERGLRPLLKLIDEGRDMSEFSAADLVVGKAAAELYIILKVRKIYAETLGEGAYELLKDRDVSFGKVVPHIIGRDGGICPMERAVEGAKTPQEALERIREKIKNAHKSSF